MGNFSFEMRVHAWTLLEKFCFKLITYKYIKNISLGRCNLKHNKCEKIQSE